MDLSGAFEIRAPVERVWASLWDERIMPAWLPGCTSAKWDGDQRVHGEVEQSVAQLKATFAFDLHVTERKEHERLRLIGTGQGKSIHSSVNVDMELALQALDGGRTQVTYVMKTEITGALAKVGNFVLKLKARDLQQRMAQNVRACLEEGAA
jgi:hypothetical protein